MNDAARQSAIESLRRSFRVCGATYLDTDFVMLASADRALRPRHLGSIPLPAGVAEILSRYCAQPATPEETVAASHLTDDFLPAIPSVRLPNTDDSAARRRVPLVFVLFPPLLAGTWSTDTYPLRDLYARIAADARAADLHVLDLTRAFASEGGDWSRWWATPYHSHPNAAAHAVAARAIRDLVRREDLLPPSP